MIRSFFFVGFVCMIAQIIKDNTKLTSGHITSLFVIIGSILGFFNLYDKIINYVGGGASVVIMSFGNTLYKAANELGILKMLSGVSIGITTTILVSFVITLIFRTKS